MKYKIFNFLFLLPLDLMSAIFIRFNCWGLQDDFSTIRGISSQGGRLAVSRSFIDLLVIGEDKRFYSHGGVDLYSIVRALWMRISAGSTQGASTIEQQIVRVLIGRYEKTLSRKIREIILASQIKKIMAKNDIASLYLERAYFGAEMNGIKAACKKLKINLGDASIIDGAKLIARLKYPEPSELNSKRMEQIDSRITYICNQYLAHLNVAFDADLGKKCNRYLNGKREVM